MIASDLSFLGRGWQVPVLPGRLGVGASAAAGVSGPLLIATCLSPRTFHLTSGMAAAALRGGHVPVVPADPLPDQGLGEQQVRRVPRAWPGGGPGQHLAGAGGRLASPSP